MRSPLERLYSPFNLDKRVDDDYNGVTYISLGTGVGFIQPVSGNETFKEGKGGESVSFRLYTQVETPAIYGQKVTQFGESYIVLYAFQPKGIGGILDHKEILLGVFT